MDNKIKNYLMWAGFVLAVFPKSTWLGEWVSFILVEAGKSDHIWSGLLRLALVSGALVFLYELYLEVKKNYGKYQQNRTN